MTATRLLSPGLCSSHRLAALVHAGPALAQVPGTWEPALGTSGVTDNVVATAVAWNGISTRGGDLTTTGGVPARGIVR